LDITATKLSRTLFGNDIMWSRGRAATKLSMVMKKLTDLLKINLPSVIFLNPISLFPQDVPSLLPHCSYEMEIISTSNPQMKTLSGNL